MLSPLLLGAPILSCTSVPGHSQWSLCSGATFGVRGAWDRKALVGELDHDLSGSTCVGGTCHCLKHTPGSQAHTLGKMETEPVPSCLLDCGTWGQLPSPRAQGGTRRLCNSNEEGGKCMAGGAREGCSVPGYWLAEAAL